MPRRSDLEVDTSWTPADALALLDEHDGCYAATLVRLDTLRTMELTRLERVIRWRRLARRGGRKHLDELRRDTRIAIGQEMARRVMLLQEVARAHGLIAGTR